MPFHCITLTSMCTCSTFVPSLQILSSVLLQLIMFVQLKATYNYGLFWQVINPWNMFPARLNHMGCPCFVIGAFPIMNRKFIFFYLSYLTNHRYLDTVDKMNSDKSTRFQGS